MSTLRIAVVTAGLSQPSSTRLLADRLAEATTTAVQAEGRFASEAVEMVAEVAVDVVEVREIAHDLTNHVLTGFASPALQERLDAITGAGGVIVSTPVYAASYAGLFKMLIDVLPRDALRNVPVLLGATGGTPRHSLAIDHALRPLFAHLGALVAPVGVFAASQDWGSVAAGGLGERIERAGSQFARLLTGTAPAGRLDPFAEVTPFEALLAETVRG